MLLYINQKSLTIAKESTGAIKIDALVEKCGDMHMDISFPWVNQDSMNLKVKTEGNYIHFFIYSGNETATLDKVKEKMDFEEWGISMTKLFCIIELVEKVLEERTAYIPIFEKWLLKNISNWS